MGVDPEELEYVAKKLERSGSPLSAQIVRDAIDKIEHLRGAVAGANVGSVTVDPRPWPASYDETFRAIAAAVTPYGNKEFGISVKAFYRALAYPEPSQSTALNVGSVEGSATPAD